MKVRLICEKCNTESCVIKISNQYAFDFDIPKDWKTLRFYTSSNSNGVVFLLCPECAKKCNLPNYESQQKETIGDKIFDIVYEIAEQAVYDKAGVNQ